MKLLCITDLHLEFDRAHGHVEQFLHETFDNCVEHDYLVLSGDIDIYPYLKKSLSLINTITQKPVIFVPGNHEFYHNNKENIDSWLNEFNFENQNIIVLNRNIHIDDGYVFIGATGWCDESNGELNHWNRQKLSDFSYIKDQKILEWGKQDRDFFENNLSRYSKTGKKIVCVSHNVPVPRLKKINSLDTFFQNDWEHLIYNYDPNIWLCGHTHHPLDIEINGCKIVNNPRGYFMVQENKIFDKNLIVEV